jgi:hypothetical protein
VTSDPSVRVEDVRLAVPSGDLFGHLRVKSVEGSRLELLGWALGARSEVNRIEVVVDGSVVASTTPTIDRPDVDKGFPDRDDSLRCGFDIALDATGDGETGLQLRAVLSDGTQAPLADLRVIGARRRWTDRFRRS